MPANLILVLSILFGASSVVALPAGVVNPDDLVGSLADGAEKLVNVIDEKTENLVSPRLGK